MTRLRTLVRLPFLVLIVLGAWVTFAAHWCDELIYTGRLPRS